MKIYQRFKNWWRFIVAGIAILALLFIIAYSVLIFHKNDILQVVTTSLNKSLKGKISAKQIHFSLFNDFPAITVSLQDIIVTDTLFSSSDTLFAAQKFSVSVPLFYPFSKHKTVKSISLQNARIRLVKTSAGISNLQFHARADTTSAQGGTPVIPCRVILKNVSFQFSDSLKQKFFSLLFKSGTAELTPGDSMIEFKLKSIVHFNHLIFNAAKGGYLSQKDVTLNVNGNFAALNKALTINGGTAQVDNQIIAIQSKLVFGKDPTMQFNFFSKSIKTEVAYSILPQTVQDKLSRYQVYKPIEVYVVVRGSLAPNSKPYVNMYFKTENNRITFALKSIDDLNFSGSFSNHVDSTQENDDHNSQLSFPIFNGSLYRIPLQTKLVISDLKNPTLHMIAGADVDKATLESVIDTMRMRIIDGNIKVRFSYLGPLVNYFDSISNTLNAKIIGSVIINKISLDYLPTDLEFRDVTGSVVFDENDLHINSFNFDLNHNTAYINGALDQFIPSLFSRLATTKADLSLTAATINLNHFNFQSDTVSFPKKIKPPVASADNRVATVLDMLTSQFELNFDLHADSILYKHFAATSIQSRLTYANDFVSFKNTDMNAAGGKFSFGGDITKLSKPRRNVDLHASINNADISAFLKGFDNFGQTTVTDKDVDGKLKADINFHCELNEEFKVIPASMDGKMKVSITDGELKNFESLEQIRNYAFKDRDFSHIKFSGVQNEYEIKGSQINFSHLDLYSSVLTLFVEGKYDFNKANTLLMIYIPFGNIRKAKTEELAEHPDSNRKSGLGLTLKAVYGDDNKLHMSPVVFGKKKLREDIAGKNAKKEKTVQTPKQRPKQK